MHNDIKSEVKVNKISVQNWQKQVFFVSTDGWFI